MAIDDATREVIKHGIDGLADLKGQDVEAMDLHNLLYNQDYFIIGTSRAKDFLEDYGVFEALDLIQTYEQDNFGEVNTDLGDPEKVANMFAYIKGEEALNECQTLQDLILKDQTLSDLDLERIAKELGSQL